MNVKMDSWMSEFMVAEMMNGWILFSTILCLTGVGWRVVKPGMGLKMTLIVVAFVAPRELTGERFGNQGMEP